MGREALDRRLDHPIDPPVGLLPVSFNRLFDALHPCLDGRNLLFRLRDRVFGALLAILRFDFAEDLFTHTHPLRLFTLAIAVTRRT